MSEEIRYVNKTSLEYSINKLKEYMDNHYANKSELEGIDIILDNINGEVV
ncbi:MAG: hypothetical protein HFJ34_04685 [Clostridia bacterium]|nr:hypothetical protein [Clostridia bacterium]